MAKRKKDSPTISTNTATLEKPIKSSWQKKITAFFTAILGAGVITFFTPLYSVIDNATGGYLTEIWGAIATLEDEITDDDPKNKDPIPPTNLLKKNKTIGLPFFELNDNMVIRHKNYTLYYNEKHEQASWVAYTLKAHYLKGNHPRKDHFRVDPAVPSKTAKATDYLKSGYDRGHLAPAADFRYSAKAIDESFFMSNMSPQKPKFNRGMWKGLEKKVRDWATEKKELLIVSGPILKKHLRKLGHSTRVSIPKQFYKIIVHLDDKHPQTIAFLMPNKLCKGFYEDYMVSIDEIEMLTGIDFFHQLPDELEQYLENSRTTDSWFDEPEAVPAPDRDMSILE